MTHENQLHVIPPHRTELERPWFFYDYEDPAAKFRIMPADYDWEQASDFVDAGDDPAALVDDPTEGALPVFVEGYV
jgi:hypothetical protein